MRVRFRVVSIFPGTHKVGLAAWVIDDGVLVATSAGTVPHSGVYPLLERLAPDVVVMENPTKMDAASKPVYLPLNAKVLYATSGWRSETRAYFKDKVTTPLERGAWALGWSKVRRSDVLFDRKINIGDFNLRWVDEWSGMN